MMSRLDKCKLVNNKLFFGSISIHYKSFDRSSIKRLGHPQCFYTCQLNSCQQIKTRKLFLKHASPMQVLLVKLHT